MAPNDGERKAGRFRTQCGCPRPPHTRPGESHSGVIIRVARGDGEGAQGAFGPPFFVERRINDRVAELTRVCPINGGPQTRGRNDAMVWSTPEVREVCVGMEVTSYLSAEM
jgi:coenzyme PQQ precursor peptide PqqA